MSAEAAIQACKSRGASTYASIGSLLRNASGQKKQRKKTTRQEGAVVQRCHLEDGVDECGPCDAEWTSDPSLSACAQYVCPSRRRLAPLGTCRRARPRRRRRRRSRQSSPFPGLVAVSVDPPVGDFEVLPVLVRLEKGARAQGVEQSEHESEEPGGRRCHQRASTKAVKASGFDQLVCRVASRC